MHMYVNTGEGESESEMEGKHKSGSNDMKHSLSHTHTIKTKRYGMKKTNREERKYRHTKADPNANGKAVCSSSSTTANE